MSGKQVFGLTRNQFARVVMKSALDNACSTMFIRQWLDWFEQQPDDAGAFGKYRNEKKIVAYALGMISIIFTQAGKNETTDSFDIEELNAVLETVKEKFNDEAISSVIESEATAEEILTRVDKEL
jgi:hypothetical protein